MIKKFMFKVFNMVDGEMQEILFPTEKLAKWFIEQNPEWHMNRWCWEVTIEN